MTAVQYTSGAAKIRSSLLRTPVWKGDDGGMMNTVSAFSSESQWCVRNALWAWKPERSAIPRTLQRVRRTRRLRRTHDVRDHAALVQLVNEALAEALDLEGVRVGEDDIYVVALLFASPVSARD